MLLGVGALGAADAYAVALGEIKVDSYLNEPFVATVPARVDAREQVTQDCITLALPPGQNGNDVGISYLLDATVGLSGRGRDRVVTIRSRNRVVDPVLGLVLRVDCQGSGTMLREYTVLLDPHLPAGLQTAYARRAPPQANPAPRRKAVAAKTSPQAARSWRVRSGENLSRIAAALAPGDRREQLRLIDAIVATNPEVFPDGDPNRLPAGALLKIPGAADRKMAQSRATGSGAVSARTPAQARAASQPSGSPRLTLSNREQVTDLKSANETARMVTETRRLLMETETQYADTEALKARLNRLERQIALLERTLRAADRVTQAAPSAASPEARQPARTEASQPANTAESATPQPVAVPPAPAAAAPTRKPPVEIAATAVPEPRVVDDVQSHSYWWWLAALVLVGAGLLGWRIRRAMDSGQAEETEVEWQLDQLVPEPAGAAAAPGGRSGAAMGGEAPDLSHKETVFSLDPLDDLPEHDESEGREGPADPIPTLDHELTQQMDHQELMVETFDFEDQESAAKPEMSNILVRAEFYLLLRQPENAVRLLRESIEGDAPLSREPALWLMLLRVYRQERMQDAFNGLRTEFAQLFNIAVPEWEEAEQAVQQKSLERDFPRILNRITSLWDSQYCADFLDSLLRDDREGTRRGFDLDVAEELLLLKGVWRGRQTR